MGAIAICNFGDRLEEVAQIASDLMLKYLGSAWAQQDKNTKWKWKPICYKRWMLTTYTDRISISWDSDGWVFNIDESLLDSVMHDLRIAFPEIFIERIPNKVPAKHFYEHAYRGGKIKNMPEFPSRPKEVQIY